MQITILSDNRPGTQDLKTEHGLSILVKTDSKCILCDTGASSMYAENALAMGLDLSAIDFCFISHAHNDHTGGLRHFLEHSGKPIFISSSVAKAVSLPDTVISSGSMTILLVSSVAPAP